VQVGPTTRPARGHGLDGMPSSLVAVGHPDRALAGIALLAIGESAEASGLTISARGAASEFAIFIRRQRCAHCPAGANCDLAAGCATVAQRHLLGAF
jgi:hypothetical protein